MKRLAEKYLGDWSKRDDRKPLILRGARQVGKTYLVENFARHHFPSYLRLDLEKRTDLHPLFIVNDASQIVQELSLIFKTDIEPGKTLLFFDEIQACPRAIASLRYFYEELPALHVMAAGSLMDFVLKDFSYSMPVGRVEFLHLHPMNFEEFLLAVGEEKSARYLSSFKMGDPLSDPLHLHLCDLTRKYFFVGGMPEAVASFAKDQNLLNVQRIQNSLLTTIENDFSKYPARVNSEVIKTIIKHAAQQTGKTVKYARIDRTVRIPEIKKGVQLLELARILHIVRHTSANGVPLGAEASSSCFKTLLLDVGLVNQICGLGLVPLEKLFTVNEGGLAEQFVGEEFLSLHEGFEDPQLYFWNRLEKNSQAEVDYLFAQKGEIYPVEVKAGTTGSLKSLHVFLAEKKRSGGIRFNLDKPSLGTFKNRIVVGNREEELSYTLLSLPLYLSGQLKRLVSNTFNAGNL